MIRFFRQIRQKLLQNGKLKSYTAYAFGEILLVVVGILIALSINTWNENRKNEKEASFQMSKLKDNLISDKEQLKIAISRDSSYISTLVYCVNVLSNEQNATKDEFIERFQDMFDTNNFSPIRGTFESLISSGKIVLISNQKLLDELFAYYNNNSFLSWESAIKDYSRNIFAPYLLNFDHVPNATKKRNGTDFIQFDISKFSVSGKTLDDYKNDQFILNAIRIKIQLFEGQKNQLISLMKNIDSLIHSIDNELK